MKTCLRKGNAAPREPLANSEMPSVEDVLPYWNRLVPCAGVLLPIVGHPRGFTVQPLPVVGDSCANWCACYYSR